MRNIWNIWQREMSACFLSPIAYVIMVAHQVVASGIFLTGVFRNIGRSEPLSTFLFGANAVWLPFVIAVVAMRLFAEEKRSGSLESLMTVPVTEGQIVIGKYLGALTFICIAVAPTIVALFVFEALSPGIDHDQLDYGALVGGGLILFMITSFFLAVGCLLSLATRNQIVAAVSTLGVVLILLYFGWLLEGIPGVSTALANYLSATRHLQDFSWGIIDVRILFLYASGTWLMLFAAVRLLESRRWR